MGRVERTLNDLNMIICGVEDKSSNSNFFIYKTNNLNCHLISPKVSVFYP